jgi:Zn ribbon nucleic-acid-binding protein
MGSKGLTRSAAICPFCSSTDAILEVYSINGVSDTAHIICSGCGLKTKNLLTQVYEREDFGTEE